MGVIDGFYSFIYVWLIIPLFRCPLYTVLGVLHIHDVSVGLYFPFEAVVSLVCILVCFRPKTVECRRMSNEVKVQKQEFLNRIMTDVP
jgi:hypothetical protein